MSGCDVGLHALEARRRQRSSELGRHGIPGHGPQTGGIPESIVAASRAADRIDGVLGDATLIKRTATLEAVGSAAAFAASAQARTMAAAARDISGGALLDR